MERQTALAADDPRPLYIRIMERLRRQILSGEIRDALTGEVELAQQLGTSRGTVQQAISGLVREGLLHRRRGAGTFVDQGAVERYYREISSFTGSMIAQGRSPQVRVQDFRRETAGAESAAMLGLGAGDAIFRYARAVALDGTVRVFTLSFLPAARFEGLSIRAAGESLYTILRRQFGATPSFATDSYTPALASGDVAAGLEVGEGTPVLRIERLTLDQARAPIEHAVSWLATGRIVVEISPMSLHLENHVFAPQAHAGQWHHHVLTQC